MENSENDCCLLYTAVESIRCVERARGKMELQKTNKKK